MNAFPYDPDCSIQDADIEMASLNESANLISRLRKRGVCVHGSVQGPPGPKDKPTSVWTCLDCGKTWDSEAAHYAEYRELMDI